MSSPITYERALIDAAEQQGLLPPEARAAWRDEAGSSWIVIVLTFLGAQLVVLPFLGFLALLSFEFFLRPPGAFVASAILIGGAVVLLRARPGMFAAQLAFSGLMAGLALLVVAFEGALGNAQLLIIFGVLIGAALVVRVTWVQRVLGFLAALVLLAVALWPLGAGAHLDEWQQWEWRFLAFPMTLNAVLLGLLWGLWVVRERAWSGRAASSALHALADGAGVALLVAVAYGSTRHFWTLGMLVSGPMGSADAPWAGSARIFRLGWPALLQMALVTTSAFWLLRHWRLRESMPTRDLVLLALAYAVLLVGCLVIPHIGVVALVGTLALGTGRRLILGLALATLLAQLSGFYYALAWPLAHKAALLAGMGAVLGLTLWAMRERTAPGVSTVAPLPNFGPRWLTPVLVAAGAVLALGMVHIDVQNKEQVIAQGQKIYVPLAPRDPRSLMQGDYMALNFAFPQEVRDALNKGDTLGTSRHALVVAVLDERGVATVRRLAQSNEALSAGERLLPLKRLKDDWVLVTDAFYFPEGQGTPFARARFGEFRVLPDGRALLVGLADEHLQALLAAPNPPAR